MDDERVSEQESLTPEFRAKLQAILDLPQPTEAEQIEVLQGLLSELCDVLEGYEDQLVIQSYVISYHRGGLKLVSERMNREGQWDLLPRIHDTLRDESATTSLH